MSSSPADVIYIYALVDPRNEDVRYIGKTGNLEKRLRAHLRADPSEKSPLKNAWINQLKSLGLKPKQQILEQCSVDNWQERERYWQLFYEGLHAPLTNLRVCGEGRSYYSCTDEFREKMKVINREINSRPEVKKQASLVLSRLWADPEFRAKMMASRPVRKLSETQIAKMRESQKAAHLRRAVAFGGKERLVSRKAYYKGLIDPNGNRVAPFNHIRAFCEHNGLTPSKFTDLIKGRSGRHKGYTYDHEADKPPIDY